MRRRDILRTVTAVPFFGTAISISARDKPPKDIVAHILPTVSHERIRLKISFHDPATRPPLLEVGSRKVKGIATGTQGYFWSFDIDGLEPATEYPLKLRSAKGDALYPCWSLKTFPDPGATPERFRLLAYTCAGGHDGLPGPSGIPMFIPISARRKLLQRGLSFQPDAIVANGDHVYWDLQSGRTADFLGQSAAAKELAGEFNRDDEVLGTANETVLKRAVGRQIIDLYGTLLKSTPVFFFQDDHDYFENDYATAELKTLPPNNFDLSLARATQSMYYPEFLPDPQRPCQLPGTGAPDRAPGLSEVFGTLRYGKLFEGLIYDCRRYLTLTEDDATAIPASAEAWLKQRMTDTAIDHVVNFPSAPFGWTAGKWAEWYPDVLNEDGQLTVNIEKPFWQKGWRKQHDRILQAASSMERLPVFICGDLHAIADTKIYRYGELDFSNNPIVSVLTGPLGTGKPGFPSYIRETPPRPPAEMEVEEVLPSTEENGFLIADFTPEEIHLRFFKWRPKDGEGAIARLKPFHERRLSRG